MTFITCPKCGYRFNDELIKHCPICGSKTHGLNENFSKEYDIKAYSFDVIPYGTLLNR